MIETVQKTVQTIHPRPAEPDEPFALHTLELRHIKFQDIPALVDLLTEILPEIKTYERIPVNPERVRTLIQANLDNPEMFGRIVVLAGQIVGAGLGYVTRYGFSDETHAQDMLMYVRPAHRDINIVRRIVEEFCAWAKEAGARQIFVSNTAGINPELHARLMSRFGFEKVGHILVKGVE